MVSKTGTREEDRGGSSEESLGCSSNTAGVETVLCKQHVEKRIKAEEERLGSYYNTKNIQGI